MVFAHTAGSDHVVEPELLAFGIAMLFLAVMLRPSSSGSSQQIIVALVAGTLLLVGAFLVPRL